MTWEELEIVKKECEEKAECKGCYFSDHEECCPFMGYDRPNKIQHPDDIVIINEKSFKRGMVKCKLEKL